MYVYVYIYIYVCMYACMYACMYVPCVCQCTTQLYICLDNKVPECPRTVFPGFSAWFETTGLQPRAGNSNGDWIHGQPYRMIIFELIYTKSKSWHAARHMIAFCPTSSKKYHGNRSSCSECTMKICQAQTLNVIPGVMGVLFNMFGRPGCNSNKPIQVAGSTDPEEKGNQLLVIWDHHPKRGGSKP